MNRLVALALLVVLLLAGGWWWQSQEGQGEDDFEEPSQSGLVRSELPSSDGTGQEEEADPDAQTPAQRSSGLHELNRKGLDALDAGEPERAVGFFTAALELEPEQEVILGNLATALVSWAADVQRQGDWAAAIDLLERAQSTDSTNVGSYYWLAHLQLLKGNRVGAKRTLEEALESGVEHATLLRMSADIAAVEGELDQSVEIIKRAVALDPEDQGLVERAAQLQAERQMFSTFLTDSTAHFDSRYDPQDTGIVGSLTELNRDLEGAWQDVVGILGVQPRERLLVIWLDAESYRWQAPAWSAALFDGRVRVVIEDYDRDRDSIRRTLRHELTHAVLHTMGSQLPTWLHEGLAQSAEGGNAAAAMESLAKNEPNQHLEQLVGNWTVWTDRARLTEAYAYSLGFCAWLRQEFGQSVMANLLINLDGRTFEDAWFLTFGAGVAATDLRFREALKNM